MYIYILYLCVSISVSVRDNTSAERGSGWEDKVEREEGICHLTPFCVV